MRIRTKTRDSAGAPVRPSARPPSAPARRPPKRRGDGFDAASDVLAREKPSQGSFASLARRADELGGVIGDAKLDRKPLRTWQVGSGGARQVRPRAPGARDAALPDGRKWAPVSEEAVVRAMKRAGDRTLASLKGSGLAKAPMACPEDGSIVVRAFHMARLGSDVTGTAFAEQMAKIGEVEGFRVVLRCPAEWAARLAEDFKELKLDNVVVLPISGTSYELDFWSEDHGELHVDGSVSVPRKLHDPGELDLGALGKAIVEARFQRLRPGAADRELSKHPDLAFQYVGAVAARGTQRALGAIALGADAELRVTGSYLEGGNVLVGRRATGEPYALVGKDSLEATRYLLERDLGRRPDDAKVLAVIAADLGVAPKDVVPVEQPGEFHLDMAMSLLPGGRVLVNDSRQAQALQAQQARARHLEAEPKRPPDGASPRRLARFEEDLAAWKEEGQWLEKAITRAGGEAVRRAALEAKAAADLQAAGLSVHRIAGAFPRITGQEPMNFLNGERGLNARGEQFLVTLGGDPAFERHFVEALAKVEPGTVRVHFLDRELTAPTLNAMGGLSCRAKLEGTLA